MSTLTILKLHLHLLRSEISGGVLVEAGVGQVSDDLPGCHVPTKHVLPEEGVRGQGVHVATGAG